MAAEIPLKLTTGGSNTIRRFTATDTIDPAYVSVTSGVVVGTSMTQTLTNKTLTAPKIDKINDTNGNEVAEFLSSGASAVNYVAFTSADTGLRPVIQFTGDDATVNGQIKGKGAASVISVQTSGTLAEIVNLTAVQTLTNKTLTSPTVSATGWANATHDHSQSAKGGQLDANTCFVLGSGTSRIPTGGAQYVSGTTLSSFTAEASMQTGGTPAGLTISGVGGDSLNAVGSVVEFLAIGKFSCTNASPDFTFRIKHSATTVYTLAFTAVGGGVALTDKQFYLKVRMVVDTNGAGGTFRSFVEDAHMNGVKLTGILATGSLDWTGALQFVWTAECSASSASNAVTLQYWHVKRED